jgi:flagellar motor switch protein FliN/FliY
MAVDQIAAAPIEELDSSLARAYQGMRLTMEDLSTVPFTISAELGRTQMKVRDVLALKVGSLVILDKYAGQMADIAVNGLSMAKGEIVVMGDALHIRLAESGPGAGGTGDSRA